jgi:hypothetical protein
MYYFRIRHSIDTKIIGRKYPQVERVLISTQWDNPHFIQSYVNKKAPDDVLLPTPILHKSSKLTDLLSASTVGLSLNLLISDKLKKIIEEYLLFGIQFFSVLVNYKEKEFVYWILHPYDFYFEKLDLNNSTIGYYDDLTFKNIEQKLVLNNSIDLKKEVEKYDVKMASNGYNVKFLGIERIVFEESKKMDFFSIRCVSGGIGFFISEELRNRIEKENCSGIVFTEPNEKYP